MSASNNNSSKGDSTSSRAAARDRDVDTQAGHTLDIKSYSGHLWCDGMRVNLKGATWFGAEVNDNVVHGLWQVHMNSVLDFLASNNFNALRVTLSLELVLTHKFDAAPSNINYGINPDLKGLSAAQVLDQLVWRCAQRGILVMPNFHRLQSGGPITELWYSDQYPEARLVEGWLKLVQRYKYQWNVVACDLINEPHGRASWGDGNTSTDWRLAAERIGNAILGANPKLLIFVEGVEKNAVEDAYHKLREGSYWGNLLSGVSSAPVRLTYPDKLVYSNHTYGPDVYTHAYHNSYDFPKNMPSIWERHFGFVRDMHSRPALVVGEWGGFGRPGSKDRAWQQAFAQYLCDKDIRDNFYWCVNPNSGDTGGILQQDWKTADEFKLSILRQVQPDPTSFYELPGSN